MCVRLAIPPVYTAEPNKAIDLGPLRATLSLETGEKEYEFQGTLRMLPSPDLVLETQVDTVDAFKYFVSCLDRNPVQELRLPEHEAAAEVQLLSLNGERLSVTPRCGPLVLGDPHAKLARVVFHAVNFTPFSTDRMATLPPPNRGLVDHIELAAGTSRIAISSLAETRKHVEVLRETGGFAITHCGEITPEGDGQLTAGGVRELLDELHYFLSFARGMRTGVMLPIGYDRDGTQVYREWGARLCAPWHHVVAWLNPRKGDALAEAFPGYHRMWSTGTWHDVLRDVVIWYCTANAPGVELDTGIVLAQAALELLAWTYVVLDRNLCSAKAFKKKWRAASKKIERILTELGLDLHIPPECVQLRLLAQRTAWTTGPEAIASVRNDIVHPEKDLGSLTHDVAYETRELALRYIELILLKLFCYSGDYCSRLSRPFVGGVEKVPWAS